MLYGRDQVSANVRIWKATTTEKMEWPSYIHSSDFQPVCLEEGKHGDVCNRISNKNKEKQNKTKPDYAIPDYLVRVTDLFSLRLWNYKKKKWQPRWQ